MKFNTKEILQVQNRSLSEVIFRQLDSMIMSGHIEPGERINESQLSNLLGVSRAPIREALRGLERCGLLEMRAKKGMFVRDIKVKEVEELYDIRAALDALAGEKAAELINQERLKILEKLMDEMSLCVDANDPDAYYRVNITFHTAIVEQAGNKNLFMVYEGICKRMSLFRRVSLSLPGQLSVSLDRHQKIVEAIKSKDSRETAALVKNHTLSAKNDLLNALRDRKNQ